MIAGPPWGSPPSRWALDGVAYRLRPAVPLLEMIGLLLESEDDDEDVAVEAGLHAMIAVTDYRDRGELIMRILDPDAPHITLAQLDGIADVVLSVFVGMPRWQAARIWAQTMKSWIVVDGHLLGQGVNALDLPIERATNAVFGAYRAVFGGHQKVWEAYMREVTTKPIRVVEAEAERAADETEGRDNLAALAMVSGFSQRTQPALADDDGGSGSVVIT